MGRSGLYRKPRIPSPVPVAFEEAFITVCEGHNDRIAPNDQPETDPYSVFTGRDGKIDRVTTLDFLHIGAVKFKSEGLEAASGPLLSRHSRR